jgi:hypothetical protein
VTGKRSQAVPASDGRCRSHGSGKIHPAFHSVRQMQALCGIPFSLPPIARASCICRTAWDWSGGKPPNLPALGQAGHFEDLYGNQYALMGH